MRVFALSDIHVDYPANMDWVLGLSEFDYQQDVLLLAGDVTDLPARLETTFAALYKRFKQVCYVPGNHELWIKRCQTRDSFSKFDLVMNLARNQGLQTDVWRCDGLTIVPLLSWYDFSFGLPGERLIKAWGDFYCCQWPEAYDVEAVSRYFLQRNEASLVHNAGRVISFSHFLPRIDLMPAGIPLSQRYLYPVLGSNALGAQVARLKPDIHIYGHSHVNRRVSIDGVAYINNAFGYPAESYMTQRQLICVHDDELSSLAGQSCYN